MVIDEFHKVFYDEEISVRELLEKFNVSFTNSSYNRNKTLMEIYRHGLKLLNKIRYWKYSFNKLLFKYKLFKKIKIIEEFEEVQE